MDSSRVLAARGQLVKYIAAEEVFSIPGVADPMHQLSSRATSYAEEWQRKFPDFTQYRPPEMDAAGKLLWRK